MTGTRAQLRDFLLQWFGDYFPGSPFLWYDLIVLAWIALFALILHLILRLVSQRLVKTALANKLRNPIAKVLYIQQKSSLVISHLFYKERSLLFRRNCGYPKAPLFCI